MERKYSNLIASDHGSDYLTLVERSGFAVIQNVIDIGTVNKLLIELENLKADAAFKRRDGKTFGIRNLLNVFPPARELANNSLLRSLVESVLGNKARLVRGIYFDKHGEANWKVAWHQDLTITVCQRTEVEGYGPWSMKAGIQHVQPPVSILEKMLALRLHLDDTDESNGALRVIGGSHKHGRLDAHEIQSWKRQQDRITSCPVTKGGVMVMRPLLLHASSAASNPKHRRVLHFEYSSADLPCGLMWHEV